MSIQDQGPVIVEEKTGANDAPARAQPLAASPARAHLRVASLRDTVRRVARDKSVRAALFAFALSRILVLGIFVLTGLTRTTPDPNFSGHVDVHISAQPAPIARILRQEVMTADVNWYVGIAESGYEQRAFSADVPRNWAFFPLFPLLLYLASYFTGEFALTGMTLSHLFFMLALFLLHRTCGLYGLSDAAADRCLFYVAFFPLSYFFSLPLTESLFLMLTVGSFFSAKRGRWWTAGALGALASATRMSGLLLLPTLTLLYWQEHRRLRPLRAEAFAPLLVPAGLLSFMIYLYAITGNAFAFRDAMTAWGRKAGFFVSPLIDYLRQPAEIAVHWDFKFLNFAAAVTLLVCGAVLLKRREFALATYTLLSAFVALSAALLQSQARYAMVVFPIFMVLAVAGGRPRVDQTIRAVFIILFGLLTAMFAAHFTVALS